MGDIEDTAAATTLANVCDHQTEGKQSHQYGLKHRLLFLSLLLLFSFVLFVFLLYKSSLLPFVTCVCMLCYVYYETFA
jgi:hypothetical protein